RMPRRPARSRARRLPQAPESPPFEVPTRLLPERAFVVHLRDRESSSGERAGMTGRVEHVVSGRSAEFGSVAELSRFMKRMTCRRAGSCGEGTSGRGRPRGPPVRPGPISSAGRDYTICSEGEGAMKRVDFVEGLSPAMKEFLLGCVTRFRAVCVGVVGMLV